MEKKGSNQLLTTLVGLAAIITAIIAVLSWLTGDGFIIKLPAILTAVSNPNPESTRISPVISGVDPSPALKPNLPLSTPTKPPVVGITMEVPQPAPAGAPGHIADYETKSVGTGIFSNVTFSGGYATGTRFDGIRNQQIGPQDIQVIGTGSGPCLFAKFNVEHIWFGVFGKRASLTINGQDVGQVTSFSEMAHGYIAPLKVSQGQKICFSPEPDQYHLILSPYIYELYDSYWARGN